MSEGDFPFRSFTMRSEGYDRNEVDDYTEELRGEIVELRRASESAASGASPEGDARLHDPEGAVTRTLAIAQETADRVLHDAQVEADRRRVEADEQAMTTMADAEARATKMLADVEVQATEVRDQGIAAAQSAIKVERDKAMAELAQVRRVRNDLRAEAIDLKAAIDKYRNQSREASDRLAAVASETLMSMDLPDFVDDDVTLAGVIETSHSDAGDEGVHLQAVEGDGGSDVGDDDVEIAATKLHAIEDDDDDEDLADVLEFEADAATADGDEDEADGFGDADPDEERETAADDDGGYDDLPSDLDDAGAGGTGTFLTEIRAAADDTVSLPAEEDNDSDRFLNELREVASAEDGELDSDAADRFFDD